MENKDTAAGVLGGGPCDLDKLNGRLHFIGIGGIGMSALARLILSRGIPVSGSDKQGNKITDELIKSGALIYTGHAASNASGAAGIVVSTAITSDNPELNWARANKLPVWHRSEVLAALSAKKKLIAITGTHGKTTTTAMIGKIFIDANLDPSIVIGGILPQLQSNCRVGDSDYFIAEADESDGTHVTLPAEIAVITNIEADHLENYPTGMKQILDTMKLFADKATKVVICTDDAGCKKIIPHLKSKTIGYGLRKKESEESSIKSTYEFKNISDASSSAMKVYKKNKVLGTINLSVPGIHNQYNALATIATAMESGIDFETIARSLADYNGVDRRFQILGLENNILVVDDYAHHPTEVVALLQAAQQYAGQGKFAAHRIVAIFQPHQPGRLRDFWKEFCEAFKACDLLLVADVYIARGGAIAGIDSKRFSQEVDHPNSHYLSGPTSELPTRIKALLQPNDLVITIGAGDITNIGPQLLQLLRS